jgi:predicted Zn-dependent peptidase
MLEKKSISSGALHENIAPVPQTFAKRDSAVFVKNADFTMCRLSFDLDMKRYSVAETDLIYDMLLSGNNSKLFIELSEKRGLCYDLGGGCERYKNIGELYFTFEVKKADLYEALKTVMEVLNSMKHYPDVDSVKAGYVDNAYMLYDDSCELNFTFGYDNHVMDEKYSSIDERRARYENITSERIGAVARGLFLPKNLTVTVKGDKKNISIERIKGIAEDLLHGF